jgi:hypothetical protein
MKGINPRASLDAIASVVRALAVLLVYPVTQFRKVTKREIIFYEEAAMSIPQDNVERAPEAIPETRRIIPFRIPERLAASETAEDIKCKRCVVLCFASVPARRKPPVPILSGRSPPVAVQN